MQSTRRPGTAPSPSQAPGGQPPPPGTTAHIPADPQKAAAGFLAAIRNAAKRGSLSQALFLLRQAQAAHTQHPQQHQQHQQHQQAPLQQQPADGVLGRKPPQHQHPNTPAAHQQQPPQHKAAVHQGQHQHQRHPTGTTCKQQQQQQQQLDAQASWRLQLVQMYSAVVNLAGGRWHWELGVRRNHLLSQPGADVAAVEAAVKAAAAAMQSAAVACWAAGLPQAVACGADGCSGQVPDALLCHVVKAVDGPLAAQDPAWVSELLRQHTPASYSPEESVELGLALYQEAADGGLLPHEALVMGGARLLAIQGHHEQALSLAVSHALAWSEGVAAASGDTATQGASTSTSAGPHNTHTAGAGAAAAAPLAAAGAGAGGSRTAAQALGSGGDGGDGGGGGDGAAAAAAGGEAGAGCGDVGANHTAAAGLTRQHPASAAPHVSAVAAVVAGGSAQLRKALAPRVRDFQPGLVGCALTGRVERALEVVALINQLDLPGCTLTESEYALLLEAMANSSTATTTTSTAARSPPNTQPPANPSSSSSKATYKEVSEVLLRLQDDAGGLRPNTLAVAQRCFDGPQAVATSAFAADGRLRGCGRRWQVQWLRPDTQGLLPGVGLQLGRVAMEQSEWDTFAESIRQLATAQEHEPGTFEKFVRWLGKHEPFQVVLDVSNIAFHTSDDRGGAMDFTQVLQVAGAVQQAQPSARMLAVINATRYKKVVADQQHPEYGGWLAGRHTQHSLFIAPKGIDDDWYWLYAAVRMRDHGLLVSNDRMRDHMWSLLRPKTFVKWRERHVATFSFQQQQEQQRGGSAPVICWPRPYSKCVQKLPGEVWALPMAAAVPAAAAAEVDLAAHHQGGQEQLQAQRQPAPPPADNQQLGCHHHHHQQQQQQRTLDKCGEGELQGSQPSDHHQQQQQHAAGEQWLCLWAAVEDGTPGPGVRAAAAQHAARAAAQAQAARATAAAAAAEAQQKQRLLLLPREQAQHLQQHQHQQHQHQHYQLHQQHQHQQEGGQRQQNHATQPMGHPSGGRKRKHDGRGQRGGARGRGRGPLSG